MKRHASLWFFSLAFLFNACSSPTTSPEGWWSRPVTEDDLGVSGDEYIGFNPDSTFCIFNDLTFNHEDSIFFLAT